MAVDFPENGLPRVDPTPDTGRWHAFRGIYPSGGRRIMPCLQLKSMSKWATKGISGYRAA